MNTNCFNSPFCAEDLFPTGPGCIPAMDPSAQAQNSYGYQPNIPPGNMSYPPPGPPSMAHPYAHGPQAPAASQSASDLFPSNTYVQQPLSNYYAPVPPPQHSQSLNYPTPASSYSSSGGPNPDQQQHQKQEQPRADNQQYYQNQLQPNLYGQEQLYYPGSDGDHQSPLTTAPPPTGQIKNPRPPSSYPIPAPKVEDPSTLDPDLVLSGGKKKALLIGINYFQTQHELQGCINDVKRIKKFIMRYGFKDTPETMTILTDDDPKMRPLKNNIIEACKWLVKDVEPGDCLFFHFSGHGGQQEDKNGDEVDGFDETIMPLDWKKNGVILDDELHELLVKPLKKGVHFRAVFDSCHSGTALDLPFILHADGTFYNTGLSHQHVGEQIINTGSEFLQGNRDEAKKGFFRLMKLGLMANKISKKIKNKNKSEADIIMFSGCRDDQTSVDAEWAGKVIGAMSYALISSLTENPKLTLKELLNKMREALIEKELDQKPQVSMGHEMDPNQVFRM